MKTRIAAGATIETVTPDEFKTILRQVLGEASSEIRKGPQTERPIDGITLDANGNGTLDVYLVPAGMEFALHRLYIGDDTHTPAAPYTSAAGYAYILRNTEPLDFVNFNSAAGGLPCLALWSDTGALRYRNNEKLSVQFVGGPASASVVVRAQGTLQPLTTS